MFRQITIGILGISLVLLAYAAIQATVVVCPECIAPQPPVSDKDAEPAILPARTFEPISTTTIEIPQPLPLPKINEPVLLPPGVNCLSDCPLIEEAVVDHFPDAKVMVAVAECESTFRHWDADGEVLKNEQGSSATGVFQIMASYHAEPASNLGWDIYTLEGNIAYADHLYRTQGLKPWAASKHCWSVADSYINRAILG